MPEISVIIPFYNVTEELFRKCIQSLDSQTFRQFEIIIINDGSDESYLKILKEISDCDSRIKVINQNNAGVSQARNNGVNRAEGRYVAFVDADDIVHPCFLEQAYNVAENYSADIVYGYICRGYHISKIDNNGSGIIKEVTRDWLKRYHLELLPGSAQKSFGRGPYARLVKTTIVKNVLFEPNVPIGEDVLWNLEVIESTKKRILVDSVWYEYVINEQSVTNKYDPNIEEKLTPFYSRVGKYIDKSIDDQANYVGRLAYDITKYILGLYLGNPQNKESFFTKWRKFNQLSREDPWRGLKAKRCYHLLERKTKLKVLLFRLRILYPFWMIMDRLK